MLGPVQHRSDPIPGALLDGGRACVSLGVLGFDDPGRGSKFATLQVD